MKLRKLGRSGPEVSEIGFGAWAIGGGQWGGARDEDARAALAHARERGVNFIDTALVYGEGHSEQLVGGCVRAARTCCRCSTTRSTSRPRTRCFQPAASTAWA